MDHRRATIDYHKAAQSLLKWIREKIPHHKVSNITVDFKDGKIFCNLIEAIVPGTVDPSMFTEGLNPDDVVSYALEIAKDVLGIPDLVSAEDIVDCMADEKSLITYLALFRSADRMLARGISLVTPKVVEGRLNTENLLQKRSPNIKQNSSPDKNLAYGFGIRYGEVGKPTEFIVHLDKRSKQDLQISIKCTPNEEEAVQIRADPRLKPIGESSYVVSYTPVRTGSYEISIVCGKKHIPNSPFHIKVKEPQLEFKCCSDSCQKISIEPVKQFSDSDYLLLPLDSSDNNIEQNITDKIGNMTDSQNTIDSGIESVFSNFNDLYQSLSSRQGNSEQVFASMDLTPLKRDDSLSSSISKRCSEISPPISKGSSESSTFSSDFDFIVAVGPGLEYGEVGIISHFEIRTPSGSIGPLSVIVTCPAVSIPTPYVNTKAMGEQLIHDVMFLPTEPGTYEIEVKWGNKMISGSPYNVIVNEAVDSRTLDNKSFDIDQFLNEEECKREKKATLFYSATSVDKSHTRREEYLTSILFNEIADLTLERVAVDLEMTPIERRNLFSTAKNGKLPIVFLNQRILGDFNSIVGLHRKGKLKLHIQEQFGYFDGKDCFDNELIDVKTLQQIRRTLDELRNPIYR